jgi:phosphoglycerol transferase MdoB-like AlkP superfamily enzyme
LQTLTVALILLLIGAPVVDWTVALVLIRATRSSHVRALRERAVLAVGIALATTLFLVIAVNAESGYPLWGDTAERVLVRVIIAAVGLLPLYWLWLFLTRGFRDSR